MYAKPLAIFMLACVCCQQINAQQFIGGTYTNIPPDSGNTRRGIIGSPLLLTEWAKGIIVNHSDSVTDDTTLLFNYNKVTGEVIATRDMKAYLHIEGDNIKAFTLFTADGNYAFYHVPEISEQGFYLLVASGKTCTVYKKIVTTVKKPEYHNNGLFEYGNKYAQYQDIGVYYVMNVSGKNRLPGRFFLTRRSVRNAFSFDPEKENQYFEGHAKEGLDDNFIKGIADYFNR